MTIVTAVTKVNYFTKGTYCNKRDSNDKSNQSDRREQENQNCHGYQIDDSDLCDQIDQVI